MRSTIPRDKRRFLLRLSDRSGFKYFKRDLVKDKGFWVHPSEMDEPPPYPKYIGGEGENGSADLNPSRTAYPATKSEIYNP